jgi:hypothetical protein
LACLNTSIWHLINECSLNENICCITDLYQLIYTIVSCIYGGKGKEGGKVRKWVRLIHGRGGKGREGRGEKQKKGKRKGMRGEVGIVSRNR